MTQLAFDLWEPVEAPKAPQVLVCGSCGEESPNEFVHNINHGIIGGVCTKAWNLQNHCQAIALRLTGDERYQGAAWNCYAKSCTRNHDGEYSSSPIPECWRLWHEEQASWLRARGFDVVELDSVPV